MSEQEIQALAKKIVDRIKDEAEGGTWLVGDGAVQIVAEELAKVVK
jgi:hypothetical protein